MIDRGIGRHYLMMAGKIERELGILFPGGTEDDLRNFVKKYEDRLFEVETEKVKTRWTKKKKPKHKPKKYVPLKGATIKDGGKILRVRKKDCNSESS